MEQKLSLYINMYTYMWSNYNFKDSISKNNQTLLELTK